MSRFPGDQRVIDASVGCFVTAVLGNTVGLASTFRQPKYGDHSNAVLPGKLTSFSCRELAAFSFSENLLTASIGMAALNSLIDFDGSKGMPGKAQDILFKKAQNRSVAMVGQFPFSSKLAAVAARCEIVQEDPVNGSLGVEKAKIIFPEMDIIAITGSSFINHTFEELMKAAQHAYVIVLGSTTPLSDVLFDYGVDAICGSVVHDPEKVMRYAREGASFRTLKGISRMTYFKDAIQD